MDAQLIQCGISRFDESKEAVPAVENVVTCDAVDALSVEPVDLIESTKEVSLLMKNHVTSNKSLERSLDFSFNSLVALGGSPRERGGG